MTAPSAIWPVHQDGVWCVAVVMPEDTRWSRLVYRACKPPQIIMVSEPFCAIEIGLVRSWN